MLAWVHQSIASEREFLVALFGGDDAAATGPHANPNDSFAVVVDSDAAVGTPTIPQLLDGVFESICRPLKVSMAASCGG